MRFVYENQRPRQTIQEVNVPSGSIKWGDNWKKLVSKNDRECDVCADRCLVFQAWSRLKQGAVLQENQCKVQPQSNPTGDGLVKKLVSSKTWDVQLPILVANCGPLYLVR